MAFIKKSTVDKMAIDKISKEQVLDAEKTISAEEQPEDLENQEITKKTDD